MSVFQGMARMTLPYCLREENPHFEEHWIHTTTKHRWFCIGTRKQAQDLIKSLSFAGELISKRIQKKLSSIWNLKCPVSEHVCVRHKTGNSTKPAVVDIEPWGIFIDVKALEEGKCHLTQWFLWRSNLEKKPCQEDLLCDKASHIEFYRPVRPQIVLNNWWVRMQIIR